MSNCSGCGEQLSFYDGLALAHSQNQCVANLRRRIEQIESKLGAASVIGSKAQASEATARRQEAGAAPSVSAGEWRGWAEENHRAGRNRSARACDLAAAVTEWLQRHELDDSRDGTSEQFLFDTVFAFVRGEPLPEKGNG